MLSMSYNYDYLPLGTNRRRNNLWVLVSGLAVLVVVNFIVIRTLLPPRNVLDIYQPL